MKQISTYKTLFFILILHLFSCIAYGQEVTLIDFGNTANLSPPVNWNNMTDPGILNSFVNLIDNTGASTGEVLTLTDVFDPTPNDTPSQPSSPAPPFTASATQDNFFGENVAYNSGFGNNTETTGGFTLSGLEVGKYYSFTIIASRRGVSDNRETLYTITGNATPKTDVLNPSNNTFNVATILDVQPNASGEITIQVEKGSNNTNSFGFYYIGAMQITKTSCPSASAVSWDGAAWSNGIGPTISTPAVLNGTYSTYYDGSFSACSLTIVSGTLNIDDNDYVEVENDLTIDVGGVITVQPYGSFIQNNDSADITNNGTLSVDKETAPLNNWYEYTYWSSPVDNAIVGVALSDADPSRRFTFNASQFNDEYAESYNDNILISGRDDIDDEGDDWEVVSGSATMQPGVGYAATHSEIAYGPVPGLNYRYNFKGEKFNNGVISVPVYRNDVTTADSNWNLIGNPYPSAIEINAFLSQNTYDATLNPDGTLEGAIYFWSQDTDYSSTANGNQVLNFDTNDYAYYNGGTGGTKGGDGLLPNGFIPSGQGFFVDFSDSRPSSSGDVVFNNAMRSLSLSPDNSQFFKNSSSKKNLNSIDNKLWIDLTSDNGVFNEILIGYVNGATNNDDGTFYDAHKIVAPKAFAALYSTIDGSNKKFVIQGKSTNSLDANETINLGFSTNINVATLYTLSIANLQGDFLTNNTVYIKDNVLNKIHNLSDADYTFTSTVGVFNDRFVVMFNNQSLSTDDLVADAQTLKIIDLDNDQVQFTASNNVTIKKVSIFDLLGRELYQFKGQNSSEIYNLSALKNAIFIAKVELSNGAIITKKAIKK